MKGTFMDLFFDEYNFILEHVIAQRNRYLRTSNYHLIQFSKALALAVDTYGADSEAFNRICCDAEIDHGSALQLVDIAESQRIETYRDKLSLVLGFDALYEISVFDETTFNSFREMYDLDNINTPPRFITYEEVEASKDRTTRTKALH
jgi:hypothetical protein